MSVIIAVTGLNHLSTTDTTNQFDKQLKNLTIINFFKIVP